MKQLSRKDIQRMVGNAPFSVAAVVNGSGGGGGGGGGSVQYAEQAGYAQSAGTAQNATNASYATQAGTLRNARTIWGQSFDGSANIAGNMTGVGSISASGKFSSSVATGTAPISVTSTTLCPNLNADMLDGKHLSELFTELLSGTMYNLTITVGGVQKRLEHLYAWKADQLRTARSLWGNSFNGTEDLTGNITISTGTYLQIGDIRLAYDQANNALQVVKSDGTAANFYATGGVSALGMGSGGGGGISLNEPLASINSASLGTPSGSNKVLLWNGSAWAYSSLTSGSVTSITAGTGLSGGTITSSGTIAISSTYQTYISHGQTAYGWGNHANAGYATQDWVQGQGYLTDAMKNFLSPDSDLDSLTDSGSYRLGTGNTHKPADDNYAQMLVVKGGGDTAAQIFFPYGRSTAYLRTGNPINATGSWRGWREMAFTDSNVASATKLQNARLLWGNSFDGTANVGDSTTRKGLNYVSNIMMTGSIGSDSGDHLQNIYMTYFIYGPRGIEMNKYGGESGNGGFIDFHFAGSSADYTARIIEDSTNVVSIYAKNSSGTIVAPTLQVGPGNYASGVRIGNAVLSWDSTNNALKVSKYDGTAVNFYSLGGVSALGFSAGSTSTSISNLTVTNRLTIQDGGTIASDGELYIGSTSNDATIFVNDIGSMMDYDLWHIGAETGYATFARTYCPRFYFDNTRYLQYSGGHLQFYNGSSFINLT